MQYYILQYIRYITVYYGIIRYNTVYYGIIYFYVQDIIIHYTIKMNYYRLCI
jgi:hypothetical protein